MSTSTSEPVLRDDTERQRYEIVIEGDVAGYAEYHPRADADGESIEFTHTVIDPRFEGQGLGSKLARYALDDVRSRGLRVIPTCSFIRGWLRKHPDYLDLVRDDVKRRLAL